MRLVRFLRRTRLSPQQTLPAVEELAGPSHDGDTIERILEALLGEDSAPCVELASVLRVSRHREAAKVRNRRHLGEPLADESLLLLGDVPTDVSTEWSQSAELSGQTHLKR